MSGRLTIGCGGLLQFSCTRRSVAVTLALTCLLAASVLVALRLGSTALGWDAILHWVLSPRLGVDADTAAIMQLRWPRIAAALLAGAMVAVSGQLLQTVSRNGLADPGLLGISHGTVAGVIFAAAILKVPAAWLSLAGLAGGLATGALVLGLSWRLLSANGLILIGIAISTVLGAFIDILMIAGNMAEFSRWMMWSHGSLDAVSAGDVRVIALWAACLVPLLLLTGRAMAPLMLGQDQASALGVSSRIMLPFYTILAAAFVAPVVAVTGPIAFLGLISTHVARRLVGEAPGEVAVVAMLIGGCVLLWADTAGRVLFLPMTVPAGIIVSAIGIAVFLGAAALSRHRIAS